MLLDVSTKAGYDMATALRGPDNNEFHHCAKWLLTMPLRHVTECGPGGGGRRNPYNTDPYGIAYIRNLEPNIGKAMLGESAHAYFHYLCHTYDGYLSLEKLGVVMTPMLKALRDIAFAAEDYASAFLDLGGSQQQHTKRISAAKAQLELAVEVLLSFYEEIPDGETTAS